MDISDKELFDTSMDDEPIEAVEAETPEPETSTDDVARDEQGRFAEKAKEPEPVAATPEPQGKDEANVPSWRLREEREARETAERRFQEEQTRWQRQFNELQARLPKEKPKPAPDVFENPNEFLNHGVRQAVDPIKSEIGQLREFYSQKEAVREHGAEKVKAAYDWIANGMQSRNPEISAIYQRAMSSMDPYGEIVQAHVKNTVFSQIGNDPNAWFEKELERRMADPQFQANHLQRVQSGVRAAPQGKNIVQMPPSLNKVASAHPATDDDDDMSDEGLARSAWR